MPAVRLVGSASGKDQIAVLIVEDNPGDAELVRESLLDATLNAPAGSSFHVVRAATLAEALAHLAAHTFDVVLLDQTLPDSTGLETLTRARQHAPEIPIVLLTGLADDEVALTAVRAGAQDYLVKGQVDGVVLVRAIRYAMERMQAERDRRRLAEEEEARRRAEAAEARAAALASAARGFAAAGLEELAVLEAVARHTAEAIGDGAYTALLSEEGDYLTPVTVHHARREALAIALALLRGRAAGTDLRALSSMLLNRRPLLLPALSDDLVERCISPEHQAFVRTVGMQGLIGAPIVVEDRVVGTLQCWRDSRAQPYDEDDVQLLGELAERAALALGMARAYAAAQQALSARDEFLSVAAHELRTPVTAIKGNAQMMARYRAQGTLDDQRLDRLIANVLAGTDRLTALTADLLDLSRIRAGQLGIVRRPIDLGGLVDRIVARYRDLVDGRHRLEAELPTAPVEIAGDAVRLEEVIENLVANAIKYSPEGGRITVSLRLHDDEIALTVRDEGIGLPEGAAERIFTPFQRAANATERNLPGLGLGLYIGRNIVERHGGRVWAESAGEDRGTTVHVRLPRGRVDAEETPGV
jgi:signal transduction histidine kinase/CheY-like chemotaxis protein